MTTDTPPGLWHGQLVHFSVLGALLLITCLLWRELGAPLLAAFWIAVAFPVLHQLYVWLSWRHELRTGAISRTLGLQGYVFVFFLLFGGRFLSLIDLAWLDRGHLGAAASATGSAHGSAADYRGVRNGQRASLLWHDSGLGGRSL